ncbi:MAG: hypothetical protein LBP53_00590 [Candidatus Peribacteria bacterium]|jgi:hypothetical protein|nr:hypothetical protein [Candidatus Peribacteria bacterium]
MKSFIVCLLLLFSLGLPTRTHAYYFGLKSADDSVTNIQHIESQFQVKLPLVSFIFDPWEHHQVLQKLDDIAQTLGRDRIYHITLSPNSYSAKEVAEGAFDAQYLQFFEKIKEKNLKVIFRTMHEMNGGRYPRASNPTAFKEARIHVRQLSRTVGLDQTQILFDFSVNHRDMPTKGKPSQTASLYECKSPQPLTKAQQLAEKKRQEQLTAAEKKAEEEKKKKERKDCPKFEDYYPGDTYVDIVGFTFYNRGKSSSNRLRLTPEEILFDTDWQTYKRLIALGKPLIIDEVGTTAVRYPEAYHFEKSRMMYLTHPEKKEQRLAQLQTFLTTHPEILAAIYFNVDYTDGLSFKVTGEADRAIIDSEAGKVYAGFYTLYQGANHDLSTFFSTFFNSQLLTINGKEMLVDKNIVKEVEVISAIISKKAGSHEEQIALVEKLIALKINDYNIQKSLQLIQQSL